LWKRFGEAELKTPHPVQWLSDNGPQYTATASVFYAHELGFVLLRCLANRGAFHKALAVGRNTDGRLEVFYIGGNDVLYHNWQTTAGGSWSGQAHL
jgi:hypothetical protein